MSKKPYLTLRVRKNTANFWGRRRIPAALQALYGGRREINISLGTSDQVEALTRWAQHWRRLDAEFATLTDDPLRAPLDHQAVAWLYPLVTERVQMAVDAALRCAHTTPIRYFAAWRADCESFLDELIRHHGYRPNPSSSQYMTLLRALYHAVGRGTALVCAEPAHPIDGVANGTATCAASTTEMEPAGVSTKLAGDMTLGLAQASEACASTMVNFNGGFCPVSLPLFHGARWVTDDWEVVMTSS